MINPLILSTIQLSMYPFSRPVLRTSMAGRYVENVKKMPIASNNTFSPYSNFSTLIVYNQSPGPFMEKTTHLQFGER